MSVNPLIGLQISTVLDWGLIAEWKFSRDTGLALPDWSGNGHHGTLNSAGQSWVATDRGPAINFDGVNDRYISTTCPGVLGSTNRTVEILLRTSHSDDQVLLAWGDRPTAGGKYLLRTDQNGSGDWALRIENALGYVVWSSAIDDGNWHHAVAVLDGTNVTDIILYLDNAIDSVDASNAQAMNTLSTNPVRIGDALYASSGRVFQGEIALVRIYNRALTAAEVRRRYEICLARASGVTGRWMLPYLGIARGYMTPWRGHWGGI